MRILIISALYSPETTSVGPYTAGLAEHLAAAGNRITVATTFPHYPLYRWQASSRQFRSTELINGVTVRRIRVVLPRSPRNKWWRITYDVSVGIAMFVNSLFTHRHDLVIAVSPPAETGLAAACLSWLWRCPSIMLIKDLPILAGVAVGMLRPGIFTRIATAFERWIYRQASGIVVINRTFATYLTHLGFDESHIVDIPDWAHLDDIVPGPADPTVRERYGFAQSDFVLLHTGNMGAKQGLDLLLETSAKSNHDESTKIALVGDGPERPRLERKVQELRLTNVRILDLVPAAIYPKLIRSADALLLHQMPNVVDSVVPSKLLAYMAAGKPVIAAVNSESTAAQLIADAKCGVVVPPGDAPALAGAVEFLRSESSERNALGTNGRRYAEEHFNRSRILARWERIVGALNSNASIAPAAFEDEAHQTQQRPESNVLEATPSDLGSGGWP